ncbi:MAG TPA: nuclear transport factor 2 family protein [Allosphingosinicella sp.]|nr:nuclear transport factor 2 family protein [Allosphingosinicella sp.]
MLSTLVFALAAQPAAATVTLPEGQSLTEAIRSRDAEFFQLVFLGCDPARLRTMITPDFEMYHDRGGVVATNADAFIRVHENSCRERAPADAWRSRRELVPASLRVDPVPGYGAIEDGEHLFYEWRGAAEGPPERAGRLVGRARFTQLWRLTPDGWRLARVFSYGHAPAGENAPAGN